MAKPSIPKGTRDFSPVEMSRRNFIFNNIREVFELNGFQQIETPAMELNTTLLGKYGEEGDRLIFKILDSGDFIKDSDKAALEKGDSSKYSLSISEKSLRYDLTVPFARYVVQYQNEITFPFKRYQIQPVWRADRPQKGRYREFYQCDVDIIGSNSLLNEIELIRIINDVFKKLSLKVTIKLNNRKVLAGIAEYIGAPDKLVDITVAIDKIDKIGLEKVGEELISKGLSTEQVKKLEPILTLSGNNGEKVSTLSTLLVNSETGGKGISEINFLMSLCSSLNISNLEIDFSLARGLNYYTGAIFEVVSKDFPSSICGGGRYDDLTGIFGLKDVSGVGVSFGADRIYDVLLSRNLFPQSISKSTDLLITNYGEVEANSVIEKKIIEELQENGVSVELYPDKADFSKHVKYAERKKIPFLLIMGSNEIYNHTYSLKNLITRQQSDFYDITDVIRQIKFYNGNS